MDNLLKLLPKEYRVLNLLNSGKTFDDAAKDLDTTRDRIKHIHNKALRKIKTFKKFNEILKQSLTEANDGTLPIATYNKYRINY